MSDSVTSQFSPPLKSIASEKSEKKNLMLAGLTISGSIINDANGLTDGLVNGPNLLTSAYVLLVNSVSNTVIAITVVQNSVYSFTGLETNTTYKLIFSFAESYVGAPAPSNTLNGVAYTGEGTALVGDGTPDGITSISLTT